jgi:hypothetical protein
MNRLNCEIILDVGDKKTRSYFSEVTEIVLPKRSRVEPKKKWWKVGRKK